PLFEFGPGSVARPTHPIEIVHAGAAEMAIGDGKSRRFDDVGGNVHAGAKPENGPGVLGNIGLKKRDLHSVVPILRSSQRPDPKLRFETPGQVVQASSRNSSMGR